MEFTDFSIIGISVRTTNENGQAIKDIGPLWERFLSENLIEKIPNKVDPTVYSVYTDYESDYTKPYTVILGCKVSSLDDIPEGMVGRVIPGGKFTQFTAKGDLNQGIVYSEWLNIWNTKLNRKYTADFEVYGQKALNPEDAEVDIFIAVDA